MRFFALVKGTSDKFWHIDVTGDTVTVRFGRTGTTGQAKSTRYASAARADQKAGKLIASKVRKGYVERARGDALALSATGPTPASPAAQPTAEPAPPGQPATGGMDDGLQDGGPEGLGLTAFRVEEAALAWGRPLDGYDPASRAFDPKQAEAAVRRNGMKYLDYGSDLVFPTLPFDGVPSPEEGHWWLWWMRSYRPDDGEKHYPLPTAAQRLKRARERHLVQAPPLPDEQWPEDHWFLRVAAELTVSSARKIVAPHADGDPVAAEAVPALRALVVPQLTPTEREQLYWALPDNAPPLTRLLHSALYAGPDRHLELLEQAPDDLLVTGQRFSAAYYSWAGLVAVLSAVPDQADAVRLAGRFHHDRHRHDSCTFHPTVIPGLLAVLGADALPLIETQVGREANKQAAEADLTFLSTRVHGPAAVPTLVRLGHASRAPGTARTWLATHQQALAASPEPLRGKDADVVATVVRQVVADDPAGFGSEVINPTVAAAIATVAAEAAVPTIQAGAEPAWWVQATAAEDSTPAGNTPTTLPAYADPETLPSVVVDGVRLPPAMIQSILWSAVRSAVDPGLAPRPLIAAVRDRLSLVDRDAVATTLLDGWLGAGAPPKEKALFVAAGFLGADGFVTQLVPLVRDWPGQSQHQRAVLGLDVLVATGRLTALQGISGIASKSKFKGIQEAARRAMSRLAADAGLSTDQLADRVVPDGGLDARGTRVLSFGPRSFRLALSPQGKLVVRDLDGDGRPVGKTRTGLPTPNSKDDPAAVAAARSEFTVLRKQLTELAKVQTARLEQAMISGRTWSGEEHREYLVRNPLLNSLIRPLVWTVNQAGSPILARVTEEHEYLTVDDDVVVPAADAVIALAHPLHLSEAERTAWLGLLMSYDLLPPIEQLDRAVFGLPAGQRWPVLDEAALPKGAIHPGTLVGLLDRYGWRRGIPADAGAVNYAWLPFPAFDRAVVIELSDGLRTGMIAESGDQEIDSAILTTLADVANLWYVSDRMNRFDWETADPLIVSETRRSFAAMTEKAT